MGASRVFQGYFEVVSRKFHWPSKGVSRMFQGCLQGISKDVSRDFKGMTN